MSFVRWFKNCIIVGGMNFLSLFSKIKKETISQNLQNNKKAWGEYASGLKYIENQSELTSLTYGQKNPHYEKKMNAPFTAAYNSCEIIAFQNALISLGLENDSLNFPEKIATFEKNGNIRRGYFGTAPFALKKQFHSRGVITKKLKAIPENYGKTAVQLLMFQNGKKITSGIHTVCIISEGQNVRFLNGMPDKDSVPILLWSLSKHTS